MKRLVFLSTAVSIILFCNVLTVHAESYPLDSIWCSFGAEAMYQCSIGSNYDDWEKLKEEAKENSKTKEELIKEQEKKEKELEKLRRQQEREQRREENRRKREDMRKAVVQWFTGLFNSPWIKFIIVFIAVVTVYVVLNKDKVINLLGTHSGFNSRKVNTDNEEGE